MDSPKRSIWKIEETDVEKNTKEDQFFFDNLSPETPGKRNRIDGRTPREGALENGEAASGSTPWTPMTSMNALFTESIGHCETPNIGDFNIFVDTILSPMALASQSSGLNLNSQGVPTTLKAVPSSRDWGVQFSRTDIASIPSEFCFSDPAPPRQVGGILSLKKKIPMNLGTFEANNNNNTTEPDAISGCDAVEGTSKAREVFAARLRTGSAYTEETLDYTTSIVGSSQSSFLSNSVADNRLQDFNLSLSPGTPDSAIRNKFRESSRLFSPLHWPYASSSSSTLSSGRNMSGSLLSSSYPPTEVSILRDSLLRQAQVGPMGSKSKRGPKGAKAHARTASVPCEDSAGNSKSTGKEDALLALLTAGQSQGGVSFSPDSDGADGGQGNAVSGSGKAKKAKKNNTGGAESGDTNSTGKPKKSSSKKNKLASPDFFLDAANTLYSVEPVASAGPKSGLRGSPSAKFRAAVAAASPGSGNAKKSSSPGSSGKTKLKATAASISTVTGKSSVESSIGRAMKSSSPNWGPDDIITCNCVKSRCLKLYCDCFRFSRYCNISCRCNQCVNRQATESERKAAIAAITERNPEAFVPRIVDDTLAKKHLTGCHCKRTGCLKKYCECFTGQAPCNKRCRCVGCKNTIEAHGGTADATATGISSALLDTSGVSMQSVGDMTLNSSCESGDSIDGLQGLALATPGIEAPLEVDEAGPTHPTASGSIDRLPDEENAEDPDTTEMDVPETNTTWKRSFSGAFSRDGQAYTGSSPRNLFPGDSSAEPHSGSSADVDGADSDTNYSVATTAPFSPPRVGGPGKGLASSPSYSSLAEIAASSSGSKQEGSSSRSNATLLGFAEVCVERNAEERSREASPVSLMSASPPRIIPLSPLFSLARNTNPDTALTSPPDSLLPPAAAAQSEAASSSSSAAVYETTVQEAADGGKDVWAAASTETKTSKLKSGVASSSSSGSGGSGGSSRRSSRGSRSSSGAANKDEEEDEGREDNEKNENETRRSSRSAAVLQQEDKKKAKPSAGTAVVSQEVVVETEQGDKSKQSEIIAPSRSSRRLSR